MTQRMTMMAAFAGLVLGIVAVGMGCTQRVVIVWPSEPLKVEVVNCPAVGGPLTMRVAGDGGTLTGGGEDTAPKPPPEPRHAPLSNKPLFLAAAGQTVTWVDYDGGNYGGGVQVYDADAGSDGGERACARAAGEREVWKLTNGAHWDAWHTVESGKVLCARPTSYVEGEVKWQLKE